MALNTFLIKLGVDDSRLNRGVERFVMRQPLRQFVKYAAGEMVTSAFSDMINPTEHTSYSEIGKIGADAAVNIGLRSLFMGSLAGGAVIGSIVTLIHFFKRKADEISQASEKVNQIIEHLDKQFAEKQKHIEELLNETRRLSDEKLKEIDEKIFAREIA